MTNPFRSLSGDGSRQIPPSLLVAGILGLVVVVAIAAGARPSAFELMMIIMLIPSVVLHEVSHGALAKVFGDLTAEKAGRLTLNPVKHVDVFGTILLPAFLIVLTSTAFGFAKPVPVNTSRMTRNQAMFTALVGPAVNIVLALAVALMFAVVPAAAPVWLVNLLLAFGLVNVFLAVFNLLPIPPLDGSAVIERFLPARHLPTFAKVSQYAPFLLIFVVISFNESLSQIFVPAVEFWQEIVLLARGEP
jgi:Zn-dependent protease